MKVDKTKWEKVRLGDVCKNRSTINWKEEGNKSRSYIDLTSVPVETRMIGETSTIDASSAPSRAKQIVYADDVLFGTTRPTQKRCCIVPRKFDKQICSTGFCVLRSDKELADSHWIFYCLLSQPFNEYIKPLQKGVTYPAVADKNVLAYSPNLPTLSEQRAIAAELDTLQSVIDKLQEQLNDYDKLAQSIFHEMFGDVRINDKRWDVVLLSDVCEKIFAGGDKPEGYTLSKNEINTIPIYSNGINNDGLYGFCKEAKVTDECVTVSGRGTIGYTVVHNTPFTPIVRLIVAIPKKSVNVRFLKCMLDNIDFSRTGNTIPQLPVPLFKKHRILLPPLPLQRQFAERVEAIEAQKAKVRQQIADAHQLFDSRMQYYFE